jgi:hypothetical protein
MLHMDTTIEQVETFKNSAKVYETLLKVFQDSYNSKGHPVINETNFHEFASAVNKTLCDLMVGSDEDTALKRRMRTIYLNKLVSRSKAKFRDEDIGAYKGFLSNFAQSKNIKLNKKDLRSLSNKHVPHLRELLARFPHR